MKTNQLILAAALVALAACTKDSIDYNANTLDNEIGFNAVTRKASKVTTDNDKIVGTATYPETCDFMVWGWQSPENDFSEFAGENASTAPNFMSGLVIEYTTGRDTGRPAAWRNATKYYYWPNTGTIGFMGFHPSTAVPSNWTPSWDAANHKATASLSNYSVTGKLTTDLMFAYGAGTRETAKVNMVFHHALSQVAVKVKTDADYTTDGVSFSITGLKFQNIALAGDVTYANDAITWGPANAADSWTQSSECEYSDADQTVTSTAADYGSAILMVPQPANVLVWSAAVGTEGEEGYVAPQLTDSVQTILEIGYTMQQGNNAAISGTIHVAAPQLWEVGKRYLYTINFKLNEILFNPSVDQWGDWVAVNITADTLI